MCHTDIRWLGEPQSGHSSQYILHKDKRLFWHSDVIAMTVKHSSLILLMQYICNTVYIIRLDWISVNFLMSF